MNDELLISYLLQELSTEQMLEVERWRKQKADHEAHFSKFELIWKSSKNIETGGTVDAVASLTSLKEKIRNRENKRQQPLQVFQLNSWIRVVAVLFLVSCIAWIYTSSRKVKMLQFSSELLVKADTLSDGSVVTLNKHSTLEYPEVFKGKQREVLLNKGEAFFDISPDRLKPFLIKSGHTIIRVVGTSFNVKLKNGNIEVIVESGKVQVSSRNKPSVLLLPGEKLQVMENTAELKKERSRDQLYKYYRTKEFIADNTPLWRMVAVLNEAYGSNIEISNIALRNLPLNTRFKDESLEHILEVIEHTFHISVVREKDKIILK